jgi:hypothetical protein
VESNWKALATEVVNSLSATEREEAIAYIEQRIVPAGEQLPWPGFTQSFDEPVVIAFIDLEPALNWTHRARYMILDRQGGITQTIDVDRPPFLSGVSPHLRVIHRGNNAPEWAVVAPILQ